SNHALAMGVHSDLIFSGSLKILAFPNMERNWEDEGLEKTSCTFSSSIISQFLWLLAALRNHKLPSSSTSRSAIGRVANGCWSKSVQNIQMLMSLANF